MDIDCAVCPQTPTNGQYCSYNATRTHAQVAPVVAIGVACAGAQSVRVPADGVNRGYFGNVGDVRALQCPSDTYYDGYATYLANGSVSRFPTTSHNYIILVQLMKIFNLIANIIP